jgi:hypothetical protein
MIPVNDLLFPFMRWGKQLIKCDPRPSLLPLLRWKTSHFIWLSHFITLSTTPDQYPPKSLSVCAARHDIWWFITLSATSDQYLPKSLSICEARQDIWWFITLSATLDQYLPKSLSVCEARQDIWWFITLSATPDQYLPKSLSICHTWLEPT